MTAPGSGETLQQQLELARALTFVCDRFPVIGETILAGLAATRVETAEEIAKAIETTPRQPGLLEISALKIRAQDAALARSVGGVPEPETMRIVTEGPHTTIIIDEHDQRRRCPIHEMPDCSPMLNGCSELTRSVGTETDG